MRTAKIVVGLGYGDEGKGIVTDYLCQESPNPIVVRYGGGSQCGHTVMRGNKRHVFANFGAGTLQGISTLFSEHTAINPITIRNECAKLIYLNGTMPRLYIHPLAAVITPYDVYIDNKNNYHHSTCGMGVGTAKKRNAETPCKLYASDLAFPTIVNRKLRAIRKYHGLSKILDDEIEVFKKVLNKPDFKIADYDFLRYFDTVVFEGNQGVLLDMDHGIFPDVTYSNTTSKRAIEICDKIGIKNIGVYHVTRAYHTRHGKGAFKEDPIGLINTEHETNEFNAAQGSFQTSKMDYELLNSAIAVDEIYSKPYDKRLIVTCNDQIEDYKNAFDINKLAKPYLRTWNTYSPDTLKFNKQQ